MHKGHFCYTLEDLYFLMGGIFAQKCCLKWDQLTEAVWIPFSIIIRQMNMFTGFHITII